MLNQNEKQLIENALKDGLNNSLSEVIEKLVKEKLEEKLEEKNESIVEERLEHEMKPFMDEAKKAINELIRLYDDLDDIEQGIYNQKCEVDDVENNYVCDIEDTCDNIYRELDSIEKEINNLNGDLKEIIGKLKNVFNYKEEE